MSSPFHVHLVAPSNEDSTFIKPLWVATLAAHTPDDVELTFRDDGLDPIDLAGESDAPDLVGISVNSKTAARAYAIADAYRARGSLVVLGGIHVTALPDEAVEHADAVVSGEAEWIWQDVVRDARQGKLGRTRSLIRRAIYKHDEYSSSRHAADAHDGGLRAAHDTGTALYKRLKAEGRLTKDAWWLSSDHTDSPFYRPATTSREVLRAGWVRAWQSMYSMSSIRRRYDFGLKHSWIQNVAYWPLNRLMHEVAERKIAGGDRAWRKHRALDLPLGF